MSTSKEVRGLFQRLKAYISKDTKVEHVDSYYSISKYTASAKDLVETKLLALYKIRRAYADDEDDWQNVSQRVRTLEFRLRAMILLALIETSYLYSNQKLQLSPPRPSLQQHHSSQSLPTNTSATDKKKRGHNNNKPNRKSSSNVKDLLLPSSTPPRPQRSPAPQISSYRDDLILEKKLLKRSWDKTIAEREAWSQIVKQRSYKDPQLKEDIEQNAVIDKLLDMHDPFTHLLSSCLSQSDYHTRKNTSSASLPDVPALKLTSQPISDIYKLFPSFVY